MEIEDERARDLALQSIGDGWVRAITEDALDRIQPLCAPEVVSVILTPKRYMTLEGVGALAAKYHDWFDSCTDFQLITSRVGWVGERLGIFYSFLLQDGGDWYRIEQQLYCTLSDGRVAKLHLLCSGFQLVGAMEGAAASATAAAKEHDPAPDALLEFRTDQPVSGGTCAVLTPMIRAKLREIQSGQVLEVSVNDPDARGDIESWSRLSGNPLLKVVADEGPVLRFFVQKK
jgi:TusA-related sulfurtransferase